MAVTRKKSTPTQADKPRPSILCVDDESSILEALTRFFRSFQWQTLCAESGADGLRVLEQAQKDGVEIDIVISDMRMPEMNGAEFLTLVKQRYPQVTRILLTGYSDVEALAAAVNEASIFNYVTKPWDEDLLRELVQAALRSRQLDVERRRLEALTKRQNQQLKEVNATLEDKVKARTNQLRQTLEKLQASHSELKDSYDDVLRLLSHIIDWQENLLGAQSEAVTDIAVGIAKRLEFSELAVEQLRDASLLRDIGLLSAPESIRKKSADQLSDAELKIYRKHPLIGEAALASVPALQGVAEIVRWHHEYLDGSGYPDRIAHDAIPLSARVLAVASDYCELLQGQMFQGISGAEAALQFIRSHAGTRYDANVVAQLEVFLTSGELQEAQAEKRESHQLQVGTRLAASIVTDTGLKLLAKNTELTQHHIDRLVKFEQDTGVKLNIRVVQEETTVEGEVS